MSQCFLIGGFPLFSTLAGSTDEKPSARCCLPRVCGGMLLGGVWLVGGAGAIAQPLSILAPTQSAFSREEALIEQVVMSSLTPPTPNQLLTPGQLALEDSALPELSSSANDPSPSSAEPLSSADRSESLYVVVRRGQWTHSRPVEVVEPISFENLFSGPEFIQPELTQPAELVSVTRSNPWELPPARPESALTTPDSLGLNLPDPDLSAIDDEQLLESLFGDRLVADGFFDPLAQTPISQSPLPQSPSPQRPTAQECREFCDFRSPEQLSTGVETGRAGSGRPLPPPPPPELVSPPAFPSPATPQAFPQAAPPAAAPLPGPQEILTAPTTAAAPQGLSPPSALLGALGEPILEFQTLYVQEGEQSSGRARLTGLLPVSRRSVFGATIDFATGNAFVPPDPLTGDRRGIVEFNEIYFATSLEDAPNLRFVVGKLDLTSYFDRNSFAKDIGTHFFSSVFQTNPALAAVQIGARPAGLVNWTVTDQLELKAAIYSSAREFQNFSLDSVAAEAAIQVGNAIIRGTYASGREAGNQSSFREVFSLARVDGTPILQADDREVAYGLNIEWFFPESGIGLFGRYGRYRNRTLDRGAETYSLGLNMLDIFFPEDRFGIAYGRDLSNQSVRRVTGDLVPDVLEVFYDLRPFEDAGLLEAMRLGISLQARDEFTETVLGFRLRADFDVLPRLRGPEEGRSLRPEPSRPSLFE